MIKDSNKNEVIYTHRVKRSLSYLISIATVLGYVFQNFDIWTMLTSYEYHIHALVAGALCHVVSHQSFTREVWKSKRVWAGFVAGLVPIFLL